MSSAQSRLLVPGGLGSTTVNVSFYSRQSEGSGTYAALYVSLGISHLTIVIAGGASAGMSVDALMESIIQYLENQPTLVAWYNPETGTLRSNLRAALDARLGLGVGTTVYVNVFFDGQFGPVLAA